MRQIGVFPTLVEDAAVVQHTRRPVMLLVEGELADVLSVGVANVRIGDMRVAVDAGHADHASRRGEDDAAVGQVARIVVVDVCRIARCDLAQPGSVGPDFPNLPSRPFLPF